MLPDLFVSLMDGETRISFMRFKLAPSVKPDGLQKYPDVTSEKLAKIGSVMRRDGTERKKAMVGWTRRVDEEEMEDGSTLMNDYFASPYDDRNREDPTGFTHVQGLMEPYPRPVWYSLQNDLFNAQEVERFPGELQVGVCPRPQQPPSLWWGAPLCRRCTR